jgi:uncharacterized membrane protein HdeD (DUF308 family)
MVRHRPDAVSLVLGMLMLAVGGLFLVSDISDNSTDLRWTIPAALIAIGVSGLVASVRKREHR